MTFKNLLIIILISTGLASCLSSKIEGRWIVVRVQTGRDEVRPKARWIEFYDDKRQENGSGWQKHGVGTFKIKRKKVSIVNENGYADEFDSYRVKIKKDEMEWSRQDEDNLTTKIFLNKIEETPMSHRDKILGVWTLKTVLEDGEDVSLKYNPKSTRYMLIRWDNMFVSDNTPQGRLTGVYRVEGSRYEMDMIYNTEDCQIEKWKFQVWPERLVLTSVNTHREVIMEFIRTRKIPENEL